MDLLKQISAGQGKGIFAGIGITSNCGAGVSAIEFVHNQKEKLSEQALDFLRY